METILPVVLCGGSGTRLWPLSRENNPKQFASLQSESSLFQNSVNLVRRQEFAEPLVVCSTNHEFLMSRQLQECKTTADVVLEPESKNTCAAIVLAALRAKRRYGDSMLLVLPSDHVIPDSDEFFSAVLAGYQSAKNGLIVTLGVKPTRPETGYGYMLLSDAIQGQVQEVKSFHEKPDLQTAKRFCSEGDYVWNAGIVLALASTILSQARLYQKMMVDTVAAAIEPSHDAAAPIVLNSARWSQIPAQSFDKAVLEKSSEIGCVRFYGRWSDLGDWNTVSQQLNEDAEFKSKLDKSSTQIDCKSTALMSFSNRVHVVGVGLSDTIAVATDDAVLVARRDTIQNIHHVVDVLKKKGVSQAVNHLRDYRPWGWFESLFMGGGFQVKRLVVHPGSELSLQSHDFRSEHWVVVSGVAHVQLDDDTFEMNVNESIYIEVGRKHRLSNRGENQLEVIEVQVGSRLEESDIHRYADKYNRI